MKNSMRKLVVLSAAALLCFTACGGAAKQAAAPLNVFAAASLTEALTEIADGYTAQHPEVTFAFNFDSSGTLKTQIEEGAACDLFLSAGQKQMNQLDSSKDAAQNPDGLDFVAQGSRIDLLENKVVLAVPDDNPKQITGFDVLADRLQAADILLAIGNSDVPVGQYTQKILAYYSLDEAALAAAGSLSYGSNVKEVTTQIKEGSVDAGVIYCTDAYSAGLTVVDEATAEMCGQVIYPAAVMKNAAQPQATQDFLEYLAGQTAKQIFESYGWKVVEASH